MALLVEGGLVMDDRLRQWQWPLLLLVTAASVAIFFHGQITNGFTILFGDNYDSLIEISLMQHWTNVLQGIEPWNVTSYFYPYPNTLGYNDGYLLYGVLYTVFRPIAPDPLIAATLVHMAMKMFGVVGMYLLLRQTAGCRTGWSLVGALIFSIANNGLMQACHGQLLAIAMAPWAAWLLCQFVSALFGEDQVVVAWRGFGFALFWGLWLSTAYYMAWFFAFLTFATALVALVMMGREGYRALFSIAHRHWRPLLLVAVVQIAALLPFLSVYLPKARETGMHPWPNAKFYALPPIDLLNVGPGNLLWGPVFAWLHNRLQPDAPIDFEFITGYAPAFLLVALAGAWSSAGRPRDGWWQPWLWLAIALAATWLLSLHIGNFSGWKAIFFSVPGAKGVRVIARYQIFLMLPLTAFAVRWLDGLRGRARRIAASVLAVLLVVEEINAAPPIRLHRDREMAMIAGIPPLPARCRSFYIVSSRAQPYESTGSPSDRLYPHNVDAMLIAALRARPTINGFSTFNPPDWDFADADQPDYRDRVRAYLRRHDLHDVCVLDRLRAPGWAMEQR